MIKYQILLKDNYEFNETNTRLFIKTISNFKRNFFEKMKNPFQNEFIIECDGGGKISFYFCFCGKGSVKNSLEALFSNTAEIYEIEEDLNTYTQISTLYSPTKYENKKIASYNNDKIFLFTLAKLQPNTRIRLQFEVKKAKTSNNDEEKKSMFMKNTESLIDALITVEGKTKYDRSKIYEIAHNISDLTVNEKKLYVKNKESYTPIMLTTSEFLNIFQFPSFARQRNEDLKGKVYVLTAIQRSLEKNEFADGLKLGKLYHPYVKNRDVFVSYEKLREHFICTGKTGSGKSSAIEEMIRDILENKVANKRNVPGFTFFDPAEASVLGVIDYIRKLECDGHDVSGLLKKVHYIDLATNNDVGVTFPINLMYKKVDTTKLMDFFKNLFGETPTPRLDRILMTSMSALLLDTEEHTITDIPKLLKNEEYRKQICERLKNNPYAKNEYDFLNNETPKPNEIEPVLNRLDPFVNSIKKQRMFGTTKHGLEDVLKWMNEAHIVLFNLSGMSDYDIKLIVGYIAVQYYIQVIKRPVGSLMHLFLIDESHKVQLKIINNILVETRKQGLNAGLSTQFLEQYDPDYLKSISNNIGTIISFKQGDSAARILEGVINRKVGRSTFQSLNKRVGILTTEDCGEDKSIMIKVEPPYRYTNGKVVDYKDTRAIENNTESNRKYAHELMRRDFISNKKIDEIIFKLDKEYKAVFKEEK